MTSFTGSCICNKITFSYTGEPKKTVLCHCRQCQKLSGSAYTYCFLVPREDFKWTSGSPKAGSFVQESGIIVDYSFCPDCGTIMTKQSDKEDFKPFYIVQAGTVDGDETKKKPDVEFWVSRKVDWVQPVQGVEQMVQFE
ncbi:unnamed protein product [Clonostachys chloroleuca]|uniref:CENP-V/GFA domain-containing protein n=1 Tax=Clonostachys chloroleuca TaxID=1926264 RepID=A0AA35LS23_9HYPO|nr:unnamed protein product [Clonostachys chloroleuca]